MKKWLAHITHYDKILKHHQEICHRIDSLQKTQTDILMAQLFHDTTIEYPWLKYKELSLGEMAIDYACCYTLARALNAMRPTNILECGLGQSSRLIHQYAAFYGVNAITCEHDKEWIDFMSREVAGRYKLNIQKTELETIDYKGQKTLTYADMSMIFEGQKFDFLFIDGPFGSPHYSRSQIIDLCQNNLSDRFCIIIDDTERQGEQETIAEIKNILNYNKIPFSIGEVASRKSHSIICSKVLHFLTTM